MGPPPNCGMPIAECGLKKKIKKIRNPKSEITGPMLFPHNALASEPQASFFGEKGAAKAKEGRPEEPLFFCEFKIKWNHRWWKGIILIFIYPYAILRKVPQMSILKNGGRIGRRQGKSFAGKG